MSRIPARRALSGTDMVRAAQGQAVPGFLGDDFSLTPRRAVAKRRRQPLAERPRPVAVTDTKPDPVPVARPLPTSTTPAANDPTPPTHRDAGATEGDGSFESEPVASAGAADDDLASPAQRELTELTDPEVSNPAVPVDAAGIDPRTDAGRDTVLDAASSAPDTAPELM